VSGSNIFAYKKSGIDQPCVLEERSRIFLSRYRLNLGAFFFLLTLTIQRLNHIVISHYIETESVKLSQQSAEQGGQIWSCISFPVISVVNLGLDPKMGFSVINVI